MQAARWEGGDLRNEELTARMCEVSPVFALLSEECKRGWEDANMEKVWNRREARLAGNGGGREKSKEHFDHVDSYYESYHEGLGPWLQIDSWNRHDVPVVLDFGAAPGGAVKFWIHDCFCKVIGITLPWTRTEGGMKMLYRHPDFSLILEDLAKSSYSVLKEKIDKMLDYVKHRDAPMLFDVVHHGAIIHRGQRSGLKTEADNYALRLDANVFKLCFHYLRHGGHLLLVINPLYNHMCLLSLLLPHFEDFAVHRTGFRSSSKFRILLMGFKKHTRLSEADKAKGVWPLDDVADFLGRFEELGCDMFAEHEYFSVERALSAFETLRPKVEALWFDQLKYLMYLRLRAAEAVTEEEMDSVSSLIRGGEGWKIAAPDIKNLFLSLGIDDKGISDSALADEHRRMDAANLAKIQEESKAREEAELAAETSRKSLNTDWRYNKRGGGGTNNNNTYYSHNNYDNDLNRRDTDKYASSRRGRGVNAANKGMLKPEPSYPFRQNSRRGDNRSISSSDSYYDNNRSNLRKRSISSSLSDHSFSSSQSSFNARRQDTHNKNINNSNFRNNNKVDNTRGPVPQNDNYQSTARHAQREISNSSSRSYSPKANKSRHKYSNNNNINNAQFKQSNKNTPSYNKETGYQSRGTNGNTNNKGRGDAAASWRR